MTPAERQLAERQRNYVRSDWAVLMGVYPWHEPEFTFTKEAEKAKPREVQSYVTVLVKKRC